MTGADSGISWLTRFSHRYRKNLALLEMNKTLPLLFRDYDLGLLRPQEILKYHSTFFVVQHGLDVKISKRAKI
jgi:hypothetical protein